MPFPFFLSTTSNVTLAEFFSSSTHPSLPWAATTARGVLRDVLKKHKRLPPQSQVSDLSNVLAALNEYIPCLLALDAGLSGAEVAKEEIDIALVKELEVEWRPTLTASIPGREPPRTKLRGLENEIYFTLSTLAQTHSLIARSQLHTLYDTISSSSDHRASAITSAMKSFLCANSIYTYLIARSTHNPSSAPHPAAAVDIAQPVLSALASLTLAEATLITVLKDDPYPAVIAEDRNKNSKDWMIKSPEIPRVRAHLFARLCLAAADHAARAQAMLGRAARVEESLVRYLDDLRRTARGKACRFFGIDAEVSGRTGEGIAWLRGAKKELGFAAAGGEEERGMKGFTAKVRREWAERREDRRVERGAGWGVDAGRLEEGRVVEMLEGKWGRMNDTMNVQLVPPSEPLLASMPSGREYHVPKTYVPPMLDESVIARMRAPLDPGEEAFQRGEADSSDDEGTTADPVGAFPGTRAEYSASTSYY